MAREETNILRYNPNPEKGLTSEQVNERINNNLVKKTTRVVGKTYLQIFVDNVVNFFNILLFIIAGLMIAAKKYDSLFFLVIIIPNIVIGLAEDIHARRLMDKLNLVTAPRAKVIRDGQEIELSTQDIVLDDIAILESGMQIPADSEVISGTVFVNESLLTGEPKNIVKNPGDALLSGSFVSSGKAVIRITKVGKDSYVQTLQASAQKFRRSPSEILKSLTLLFRYIGIAVITLGVAMLIIFGVRKAFSSYEAFQQIMSPIAGSMVSMIPSGLYLLTSVALATAVIKLSKHQARVQDFYSVEMLARVNVLCVDKTGTITDGTMSVTKVIPFGLTSEATIMGILSDFVNASEDTNVTAQALKKYFNKPSSIETIAKLPFNSENKYSAITFKSGATYVLGAAEYINLNNKIGIMHRIEEYASKGSRVLVLARSHVGIINNKVEGNCEAIGMVLLQDHIRPDAIKTFALFKENNVSIRVISGDDPQTVAEVARQAGIEGSEKYISLAGMSIEEVKNIANEYVVFGRVTPEQKEVLIKSLKENGNTVAMTGDGVNDILALKRADCSIAMASGAEAAKNVSHIVLLDSNFDHLPMVVSQGRRVINNLQRTASLFLIKTAFAMTLTLAFLIAGIINKDAVYPFETNHLYIWEIASIGAASFFLALEPNAERLKGTFLRNIFRKALPAAFAMVMSVVIIFGLYHLQKYDVCYTAIYSKEAAVVMCAIVFTVIANIALLKICLPFSKYRAVIYGASAFVTVALLVGAAMLSYFAPNFMNIFHLNFKEMNPINYLVAGIVLLSIVTLYLAITYIVETFKGEHKDVNN